MLSEPLKAELYFYVHAQLLNKCPIFVENYDVTFLASLSKYFVQKTYSMNDVIIREDVSTDNKIYFIVRGSVNIYHHATDTQLNCLKEN